MNKSTNNIHGFIFCCVIIGVSVYFLYQVSQNSPSIKIEPERITIEQVMQHEVGHFSVKYKNEDNELIEYDFGFSYSDQIVKVIADVPEGEPIWALINQGKTPRGEIRRIRGGEIHIHSASGINGGGWNHGKYGSGQTVPIESN